MTTSLLTKEVMKDFLEIALEVGGDLGQSQHLLELIRDKYCPDFEIPNMWVYEIYKE